MPVRPVLRPASVDGLAEEFERIDEIKLIQVASDVDVETALSAGAPILLTFTWRERILTSSLHWNDDVGASFEQYPLEQFDREGVTLMMASVLDGQALIAGLTESEMLSVSLDVFKQEPLLADSPLWDMSNVVITPRFAGNTPRPCFSERLARIFRQNLRAFHRKDASWMSRVADGVRCVES